MDAAFVSTVCDHCLAASLNSQGRNDFAEIPLTIPHNGMERVTLY